LCGIAGLALRGARHAPDLTSTLHSLEHRGPDGQGAYVDDDFALAHRRLAIIDLTPAGAQPMRSSDGRYVIVYNGEIYNFPELRHELAALGVGFKGGSDTEVLLEGYARFGLDILTRLNGVFAFAIADLATRQLVLARDPLGVKPLYWSEGPFGVAFASEIKALFELAPIEREIDAGAIRKYLTFLWCPGPQTPLKAVRKLDPGAAMILGEGRVLRHWRYWNAPVYNPRRDWTAKSCADELQETVDRVIRRQMISDAPLGAFLSGGVDSTAIVAAARGLAPDLQCFTIRIADGARTEMDDDLDYARLAARAFGVGLTEIGVSARDIVDNVTKMVDALDEPLADPAGLNLYFMSKAARETGIKVLLSGAGGDDLMSGYRRHTAAMFNRLWDVVPLRARRRLSRASKSWRRSTPTLRRTAKLFADIDADADMRLMRCFAWTSSETLDAVLDHARFRSIAEEEDWSAFAGELAMDERAPDLEKCLRLDRRFFLADHNLVYTDKMGMAAGVEIRVPLLDLDLVAMAARIPVEWKHRGLTAKWMFKQSQRGVIPQEIIGRPKRGFGVPLRLWMRTGLRQLRDDLLSPESLKNRGLFNPAAVALFSQGDEMDRADAAYTLFAMMCVEAWCRRFIDPAQGSAG
jgi:asparagine synthase (glutamine-hydrolysing)